MKKSKRALALLLLVLLVLPVPIINAYEDASAEAYTEKAERPYLGVAGNFNIFTLEDLEISNVDAQGRVAIGGNAKLDAFTVGGKSHNGIQLEDSSTRNDLIIAGNVNASGIIQHGNILVDNDSKIEKCEFNFNNNLGGKVNKSELDKFFKDTEKELIHLSETYADFEANANAKIEYETLHLKGENKKYNIFSLEAEQLNNATEVKIEAPKGSTIIINVEGNDIKFPGGQVFYNGKGAGESNDVTEFILWNMPEATKLSSLHHGIVGSVLAPKADAELQGGQINGNLIVKSQKGKIEAHSRFFAPTYFPSIPEEPTKPSESTEPTKPSETTEATEPSESTEPTKPSESTEPTKPSESTEATEPSESIEPTKPSESTEPTKPSESTEPTEPSETTEPIKPSESTEPTEPSETTEATKPSETTELTEPSSSKEESTSSTETSAESTTTVDEAAETKVTSTDPKESVSTTDENEKDDVVKTGEGRNVTTIILLGISTLVVSLVYIRQRYTLKEIDE